MGTGGNKKQGDPRGVSHPVTPPVATSLLCYLENTLTPEEDGGGVPRTGCKESERALEELGSRGTFWSDLTRVPLSQKQTDSSDRAWGGVEASPVTGTCGIWNQVCCVGAVVRLEPKFSK